MAFVGAGVLAGSGVNARVAIGMEETTFGTVAAAQMWGGLVNECTFTREDEIFENRGITAKRTINYHADIATRYKVALKGEVDCGVPLAMALGSISLTTDPVLNVFRGSEDTQTKTYLPSWSIIRSYDEATDDATSILGVTIDRGEFNIDLDGPFTFSLDGTGKSQATTALTPQTTPGTALGGWNTTVKVGVPSSATFASSGAVTITGLKNIGFSINNNPKVRNEWGTRPATIRQPIPGGAELEMSMTRGFIDDDFWDELCNGVANSYQIVSTDGTTSLTIELDDVICKTVTHTTNLEDQSQEVARFSVKTMDCDVLDAITYVAWA